MRHAPYELALESKISGARPVYRFYTADGVCSKQSFRNAELLLIESLWGVDLGRLLALEANYGVVGVVLADRSVSVSMVESSARAVQLCERNARENSVDAATALVADVTALGDTFDTVAYAPKPYTPLSVGKQRIVDGLSVLQPDGSLYLAASKQTGLTRYERCLRETAATVEQVAEYDGCALLEATRPRSFERPAYVSPREIRPEIDGVTLSLVTVSGLFSPSKLDDGTRLLLETITVEDGERVLDLCCGYGAIGTYAGRVADCDLWLSDDDAVATSCAECSLRASRVDGTVVTADCAEGIADQTFDRVLCNPPTHAGGGVLSELFSGVHDVLAPDGELEIVHHREVDLRSHLSPFGTVERLRTGDEYIVLRVSN
ncbi:class I SAM-dependent methyltransferase [Halopelagius longus]|uniref:16S rRNA (Guanine1207-N2)-methyltransferase n=1 Tax=Halopelagius longus TaxID=1236180 RepID=A0A1H0XVM6_9EURY|nr:methyltransferase [Halopelagius longus]RDI72108.1 class I SAM-dependent methyltransferase [Halopelagius longus]SDQ06716.1 16S rRNA (guanine1207-N2)-methyltransferase [Halopelagius longus]